jgi:hypothetical protein
MAGNQWTSAKALQFMRSPNCFLGKRHHAKSDDQGSALRMFLFLNQAFWQLYGD